MLDRSTKFYKVTAEIVANWDKKYKDMTPAQIGRELNVPSGVAGHIVRTILIMQEVK